MFDFAWSEIALIGVVALIAIGPKDMPMAIKTVANMVKKARRMAGEFQTHVDEMVREANLGDVRSQINELRSMDIRGTIARAVDSDGSIRKAFNDDPFNTSSYTPPAPAAEPVTPDAVVEAPVAAEMFGPPDPNAQPDPVAVAAADEPHGPPAWLPPKIATAPEPPAFIPPKARFGLSRPDNPFVPAARPNA